MSGRNNYSDYGSGSSSNSSLPWLNQEMFARSNLRQSSPNEPSSVSYQDLASGRCTLRDIMKDFQMNGSDSPYTPDEYNIWGNGNPTNNVPGMSGMGPSTAYLRQKSWPEPERTPPQRLPRPPTDWMSSYLDFVPKEIAATSTPVESTSPLSPAVASGPDPVQLSSMLSEKQLRVLQSLPNAALFYLLEQWEQTRDGQKKCKRLANECRFCKNNGERESYYRSHALKDGAGRVQCPVLRAFTCARCGARGDHAHTIKYCPLTSHDERMKSAAMMRSVRFSSGRRRYHADAGLTSTGEHDNYITFGETTPSVISDSSVYNSYVTPLDPLWAALEKKLMH